MSKETAIACNTSVPSCDVYGVEEFLFEQDVNGVKADNRNHTRNHLSKTNSRSPSTNGRYVLLRPDHRHHHFLE